MTTVILVNGQTKKQEAKITWDGKKLESDDPELLDYLKKLFGSKDGEDFLRQVMQRYKSGYMHAYKIGK